VKKLNARLSVRYFLKNKNYTTINILGLSLGLATFYILSYLIYYNLSFDRYQTKLQQIYRVDQKEFVSGKMQVYPCSPFALPKALIHDFPEIKRVTRVMHCSEFISSDKKHTFWERNGIYADSNFFELFDYEFIEGSSTTALSDTSAILLSEGLAKKYFPDQSPIGKTVIFQAGHKCTVTAIYKCVPGNSNLSPDYIVAFPVLRRTLIRNVDSNWDWCMSSTYILVDKKTNPENLEKRMNGILPKYWKSKDKHQVNLWPLKVIRTQYYEGVDSRPILIFFGAIALLVLVVASINFTNLSISYSTTRLKEITLKKIYGGSRISITWIFIGESLLFSFVSLIFALGISEIVLPWINHFIQFNLNDLKWNNYGFLLFIFSTTIFTALISGIYPALMLTSVPLTNSLKSNATISTKSPTVRKILVVFQFIISTTLITCTMVLYLQMQYMKKINLGLTNEKILVGYFQLNGANNKVKYASLKKELLQNSAIDGVTWAQNVPFYRGEWWNVTVEGKKVNEIFNIQHNHVDYDFIKTFGIKLTGGRVFSSAIPGDTLGKCIINSKAANLFGWGMNPIGKHIYNDGISYEVIGIMDNFYFSSVSQPIDPCFISYTTRQLSWPNTHAIRIKSGQNMNEVKDWVTQKFREYFPNDNLEFIFYDNIKHQVNFGFIEVLNFLIGMFSIIAVIIASLGLYGLISFVTKQRTKEIGIRKANGARTMDIYKLIAKEFIYMLGIANVIAWPLSYFISQRILVNFTNHINIGFGIFLLTCVISLCITLFTISLEIIKASNANPVEALRYE
jgi:putative ABC transport system permease protein